ncbi:MAG TPA: hypothetical protein VEW67_10130 [Thermoleophilaceae bacterium]|nr:hypothetical protein [Thermoleophilaceae bacterium]
MEQSQFIWLAFASLMALALVGTYVLGDNSWMAYLLVVPALLILRAMGASRATQVDR